MNSIVEEVYEQLFKLPKGYYNRPKVKESFEKLTKLSQELLKAVPEEKKKLLEDYENALNFHNSLENVETFRQGIKIGFYLYEELKE